MKSFLKKISFLAVLASINAFAGPFGMEKGMSVEAVQRLGKFDPVDSRYVYRSKAVKNGHPDFELYSLIITPKNGLCKITAVSKDIETSSYGSELASRFKDLKETLKGKYGNTSNDYDFLMSGSIWNKSNEWMMSLRQKERSLASFWNKEASSLTDSLTSIRVEAKALSTNKGYIVLSYEFDNIDACMTEKSASTNSSL